ncbi:hypothetical protein FRC17_007280, partial [Serendipita sp. 399]
MRLSEPKPVYQQGFYTLRTIRKGYVEATKRPAPKTRSPLGLAEVKAQRCGAAQ